MSAGAGTNYYRPRDPLVCVGIVLPSCCCVPPRCAPAPCASETHLLSPPTGAFPLLSTLLLLLRLVLVLVVVVGVRVGTVVVLLVLVLLVVLLSLVLVGLLLVTPLPVLVAARLLITVLEQVLVTRLEARLFARLASRLATLLVATRQMPLLVARASLAAEQKAPLRGGHQDKQAGPRTVATAAAASTQHGRVALGCTPPRLRAHPQPSQPTNKKKPARGCTASRGSPARRRLVTRRAWQRSCAGSWWRTSQRAQMWRQ